MDITKEEVIHTLTEVGSFTPHEANAIYHEHVAPLITHERASFLIQVYNGVINKFSTLGRLKLVTSRGL